MNMRYQSGARVQTFGPLSLPEEDFHAIARIVHQDFGLYLPIGKKDLVVSRLTRRVKDLGLQDFSGYVRLLDGPDGHEEVRALRSILTTNVTRFFREDHQFAHLRDRVLPPLLDRARAGGRVRLWSAGCSTGQEPYSLALTLLDMCPNVSELDVLILATDIDPRVLKQARAGVFPAEEVQAIPLPMRRHLADASALDPGLVAMGDAVRRMVRFAELNLMGAWPMRGALDIIFCRNVVIYFNAQDQAALWQRFAGALPVNGYLFIGHSERLAGSAAEEFDRTGNNVFRKRMAPPAPTSQAVEEAKWH